MKKWMKFIPVVAAAVACLTGLSAMDANASRAEADMISNGIYIGDVSVGGMNAADAQAAIGEYVKGLSSEKVILMADTKPVEATVADLGLVEDVEASVTEALNYGRSGNLVERYKMKKDLEQEDKVLPLNLKVDDTKVKSYLESHLDEINQDAVNYGLTRENGEFKIVDGANGLALNVDESAAAISDYFAGGWYGDPTIDLVVDVTEPEGTAEELMKVTDVLGKFSTDYSSSASGRKKNVANGCSKIVGTVLYPGETFSVYGAVSPFSEETGYALAGSYENGTTVQTYGGGICQVSTTLYNAVIRAELEIVERYGHSMLVSYVDPSSDAAIAGTSKDLKFKNNTDAPIYIDGYADGATIGFTIYGHETRPANREVSFVSETTGTTQPTTEYKASGAAIGSMSKVQSSHVGKTAQLWKIVTVDGVEQSREIFNKTTYRMSPTIYEVGTASSSSEASAAMRAAIATNNEGTIRAAMAKWNANAVKKAEEEKQKQEAAQQPQEPVQPEPAPQPEATVIPEQTVDPAVQ